VLRFTIPDGDKKTDRQYYQGASTAARPVCYY